MAWIRQFKDFKLFQPTNEEVAAAQSNLFVRLETNRKYIAENLQTAK